MNETLRRLRAVRLLAAVAALALLVASCGDDGSTTEAAASDASATDETSADDGAMTDDETMTDNDVAIEATVAGGEVTVEQDRFPVPLGSAVYIGVGADVADEVHVHGYDVVADVSPDQPATVEFVADVAGVFEVELEGSGTLLFELEVG